MARLQVFLAALWWGSLSAVGFMVVPMLFMHLETPAMAGQMAAKLFSAQTWLSLFCGLLLLLAARRENRTTSKTPSPWVIAGMLLALLIEVAVKPHIVARENMALWHNLGSAFYLAQWGCAGRALWALWPDVSELAEIASSAPRD
ncbi:MAG: DUF4149 domain-containing protein [Limnohabitans sp.]